MHAGTEHATTYTAAGKPIAAIATRQPDLAIEGDIRGKGNIERAKKRRARNSLRIDEIQLGERTAEETPRPAATDDPIAPITRRDVDEVLGQRREG